MNSRLVCDILEKVEKKIDERNEIIEQYDNVRTQLLALNNMLEENEQYIEDAQLMLGSDTAYFSEEPAKGHLGDMETDRIIHLMRDGDPIKKYRVKKLK